MIDNNFREVQSNHLFLCSPEIKSEPWFSCFLKFFGCMSHSGFALLKTESINIHFRQLKEMYELYENVEFVNQDGSLNTIASPTYQTNVLIEHGLVCNGRMQIVDGMTILPMNYLTVQSNHTGRQYITKSSFSVHQYAASWFSDKDRENKRKAEELLENMEMI